MARRPTKVLCVDDHVACRDAMREVIAALMDVNMPGLDGFEAAAILLRERLSVVVILTSVGPLDPPPGFAPRGGAVRLVGKHELCPRTLIDLWDGASSVTSIG